MSSPLLTLTGNDNILHKLQHPSPLFFFPRASWQDKKLFLFFSTIGRQEKTFHGLLKIITNYFSRYPRHVIIICERRRSWNCPTWTNVSHGLSSVYIRVVYPWQNLLIWYLRFAKLLNQSVFDCRRIALDDRDLLSYTNKFRSHFL